MAFHYLIDSTKGFNTGNIYWKYFPELSEQNPAWPSNVLNITATSQKPSKAFNMGLVISSMRSSIPQWVRQFVNGFVNSSVGSSIRQWVRQFVNGFVNALVGSSIRQWVRQFVNGFVNSSMGSSIRQWVRQFANGFVNIDELDELTLHITNYWRTFHLTNWRTHWRIDEPTYELTNEPTHWRTDEPIDELTNPLTNWRTH